MQSINPTPTQPEPDPDEGERIQLAAQVSSGANWFYWIAGLSLINTIIAIYGVGWSFSVGLAFTQVVDALAGKVEGPVRIAIILVDIICVGVFVVFGILGNRLQAWAIIFGTVLYLLDGILLLGLMAVSGQAMILGVLIHGFATYQLIVGYFACRRLDQLKVTHAPPGPEVISTMGQN